MKYIVCEKPGEFQLKEKDLPVLAAGEVMLAIKRVGICGTDLHAFSGNQAFFSYPRILGHELAAEVVETAPNVKDIQKGDRVGVMPYLSCRECAACQIGKQNCCTQMRVLGIHIDGGMQEFITVPGILVMSLNDLSYEQIALIEPLAIGAHAIRRAQLTKGETIAVVGCGPIGLGIIYLAKTQGIKVIALDVQEDRLHFAERNMKADHVVNVLRDPIEQVKLLTGGRMTSAVFDATGNKKALESGVNYMSHGGRYILVGLSKGALSFEHPAIHAKESSILCSRNATRADFDTVVEALRTGTFPVDAFVNHQLHFTEMVEHFASWANPDSPVIKAMVHWGNANDVKRSNTKQKELKVSY